MAAQSNSFASAHHEYTLRPFNKYVDKMREGGPKMAVVVHAQGKKTVHAGRGGVKNWQNSVHVVVE